MNNLFSALFEYSHRKPQLNKALVLCLSVIKPVINLLSNDSQPE